MKLAASALLTLFGVTSSLLASCNDVYISEYIEGGAYNKAIEIYNPTSKDVDLSNYSIELYSNGKSSVTASTPLSGTLSSNSTFVISHGSASAEILAVAALTNSSVINFNGDDAFVLKKGEETVDSIGQIGVDPGSEWSNNSVGTKDETLVKLENICGDINAFDSYDPSISFQSFAKDTFSQLASHNGTSGNQGGETDEEETVVLIHEIQGDGTKSPMIGDKVTIEGIVVADYQDGGFKGFYVQEEDSDWDENEKTSESVFVYCNSCSTEVNEGDLVKVKGTVTEFKNLTEITNPNITVLSSENELPSKSYISLPLTEVSDLESYEGMLVEVNGTTNDLVVTENYNYGRYGSFTVASERIYQFTQLNDPSTEGNAAYQDEVDRKTLLIDDGSSYQNPEKLIYPGNGFSYENTLRAGYTISSITGVIDERYNNYALQPNSLTKIEVDEHLSSRADIVDTKQKRNSLRVASFNVLNYFNTFEGCSYGVAGDPADCRGADNMEEFQRQKAKIVNAMLEIEADVYGLMEIENDGYGNDSAIADLVNALNEKVGKNIYKFVNVDRKLDTLNALGDDAIKVAFIYNKKRVAAKKTAAFKLDDNNKNRVALTQVFKLKRSNSKKFLVTVNHFKSKGSSCKGIYYDGVEDLNLNDGQGNCALTRVEASKNLLSGIKNHKKLRKINSVVHIGDFNAYSKEEALKVLEDNGYVNALTKIDGSLEKHTYIYYGQAGLLDHAFVNNRLWEKLRNAQVWSINSDEPRVLDYNTEYKSDEQIETIFNEGIYRSSDHDPVILDFRL